MKSTRNRSNEFVFITGATGGLGEKLSRKLASLGVNLILGGRRLDACELLAQDLSSNYGVTAYARYFELANVDSIREFFSGSFVGELGLVHTAAELGPVEYMASSDSEAWIDCVMSNINGTFLTLKHAANTFSTKGGGSIVVLSGGGASSAIPGLSSYAVSKLATVKIAEQLAEEMFDSGIIVNAVAPGILATRLLKDSISLGAHVLPMTYIERIESALPNSEATMSEAIDLIVFLLRNRLSGLTGRLVSSLWDNWREWSEVNNPFGDSEIFKIRRRV